MRRFSSKNQKIQFLLIKDRNCRVGLKRHLQHELRNDLSAISLSGSLVNMVTIVFFCMVNFKVFDFNRTIGILALLLFVTYGFRLSLTKFTQMSFKTWHLLHTSAVFTHSVLWSQVLTLTINSPVGHQGTLVFSYTIFAGMIAASTFLIGYSRRDYFAFLLPLMASQLLIFADSNYDPMIKASGVAALFIFSCFLFAHQSRAEKNWLSLRKLNYELQSIIDAIPGGISVINDGKYVITNKYIEQIVPTKTSIVGTELGETFGKDHKFSQIMGEFISSDAQRIQFESELAINGQRRTHLVTAVKCRNQENLPETIISTIDVHDLKEIENQIVQQKMSLEHNAKMASLGEMSSGLAHEINNPVAIISGLAQQLTYKIKNGLGTEESLLVGLEKIYKTTNRIAKIVKGLRTFSRDHENDPPQIIEFKSLLEDTLTFCEAKFKHHGIELKFYIEEGLELVCSPTQISQVLLNSFNNSYDSVSNLDKKWIEIHAAKIYFKNQPERVLIRIIDSGSGIPVEIRDHLMKPFFSTKDVGKGTGLGLSISKGIIESHNGELYFNYQNSNTELCILLPVQSNRILNLKMAS